MAEETPPIDVKEEAVDLAPFDPTKKKKKKKVVIQEPADDAVDQLAEKTENLSVSDGLESSFSGTKKKKKKQVDIDSFKDENTDAGNSFDDQIGEEEEGEGIILHQYPWEGSSKDYNMHRQPEHVMNFLLAEMGTNGSLDGQQRLVVKGRFAPKNFEGILRRYVNEYVICSGCKSPDTILSKENRLFFLRCEKCGSSRSVAPIKTGFVALVGRRKAGT